jgi:ABC-type dipeptide/oligopeptide/nickel transport system ATPase component
MQSYIENLITEIDKTHKSLGNLIAVLQIAVKARKFVLIVSPSGCGKSRAMEFITKNTSGSWSPTSVSISSLANKTDKLNSFRSVICIDDVATIQTMYSRTTTITTLSALCYSHRVEPSMVGFDFSIEDFYGSALMGIQPILLRDLMLASEWEASIQDKALRYYHLYRPLTPCLTLPDVKMEKGLDIDTIKDFEPDIKNKDWKKLLELGDSQWSKARTKEHMRDMLKAVAALENRQEVIASDYTLLAKLLKPMAIENIVVVKEQLEGERYLDNNLLALLAEYFTYKGEFPLAQIALDYKLTISQCYRIMGTQNGNWQQISKSPTIYVPSKKLVMALKSFELEVKK